MLNTATCQNNLLYHSTLVLDHPLFSCTVFYEFTTQTQICKTCKEGLICVYVLTNSTLTENKEPACLCCAVQGGLFLPYSSWQSDCAVSEAPSRGGDWFQSLCSCSETVLCCV